MVRSERGRTGRHVMICNVVDANIFGQCWLPAKRVKILFPCDRCVCFFVGIGRALRTQRKVSLFVVVFLSFFSRFVSIYTVRVAFYVSACNLCRARSVAI